MARRKINSWYGDKAPLGIIPMPENAEVKFCKKCNNLLNQHGRCAVCGI